ncbi:MAG: glycoside hydrolase family 30 protein [Lacipirellulaceae bacterium]
MRLATPCFVLAVTLSSAVTGHAEWRAYRSSADGAERLAPVAIDSGIEAAGDDAVAIDTSDERQTIVGLGGTFSESSAYNLRRLSPAKRAEVIHAFFSPDGAGYSLIRVPIGSCDASSKHFTFNENAGDERNAKFSIDPDVANGMIPALREALAVPGADFKVLASPWTAPLWMKDSGAFNKGRLRPEHQAAYAGYLVEFLDAYRDQGVSVWGLTAQNEPEALEQKWDAMGWDAAQMRDFLRDHLIPAMRGGAPDVKLVAYDHNKPHLMQWADTLMADPVVAGAVWGFAHHWYEEGEAKLYEPLDELGRRYPEKPHFASEQGIFAPALGEGWPAELYLKDLLRSTNHGSVGWIVWGMAFDAKGGPNHAGNFNHSPVMIDVESETVHYNPSYYYLAHASKFVRPGARVLATTGQTDSLDAASFRNPDGTLVVVLQNSAELARRVSVTLSTSALSTELPPKSVTTLIDR